MRIAVLLALALVGCTTHAGPFVTNISTAGPGKLLVEKCMADMSSATGAMSMGQCNSSVVDISAAHEPQAHR